jgi:hypothetical protein
MRAYERPTLTAAGSFKELTGCCLGPGHDALLHRRPL